MLTRGSSERKRFMGVCERSEMGDRDHAMLVLAAENRRMCR